MILFIIFLIIIWIFLQFSILVIINFFIKQGEKEIIEIITNMYEEILKNITSYENNIDLKKKYIEQLIEEQKNILKNIENHLEKKSN